MNKDHALTVDLQRAIAEVVNRHAEDSRKTEVIGEFCKISESVGHHFKGQWAYDCFCSANIKQSSSYQYDDMVLDFIRDAVSEKISREQGEK